MKAVYEKTIHKIIKKYSVLDTLIISSNNNLKNLTDIKILSINDLCKFLIKKSPLLFFPYILSSTESIALLNPIIKEKFKKNSALYNLTKSLTFSQEIYKIFEHFYKFDITPQILKTTINNLSITKEDSNRLEIIAETFDIYTKTLKEQNFLDETNLCKETLDLLKKFPAYMDFIKRRYQNILIDDSLNLTKINKELLLELNADFISINEKSTNIVTRNLSKKYLNKEIDIEENDCEIKLYGFNDITDEANFIIKKIKEKITNEKLSLDDFTVAVNDINACKIFNDICLQNNIPTNCVDSNIDYELFLIKLTQYLNICENKNKLKSTSSLTKISIEQIQEEINLNFENILSETLENQFIKDKFLYSFANEQDSCLITYVKNNLNRLTLNDAQKTEQEINKIEKLSDLYNKKMLVEFIACATQNLSLSSFANKNIAKLVKKIKSIEKILYKNKKIDFDFLMLQTLFSSTKKEFNNNLEKCIKITTLNKTNHFSKILFLPCFTEKNISAQKNQVQFISQEAVEKLNKELKNYDNNFENIMPSPTEQIKTAAKDLIESLSQGQEEIIFSTHKYENKKQVIPSIFFQYLTEILSVEKLKTTTSSEKKEIKNILSTEPKQEIIVEENDILKISPSAISSFQQCPRKFYYANLLGLKSVSSFNASYGTIVHAILEVFNKNHLKTYNKETLLNLSDILLNSNNNPETALTTGFEQKTIDLIVATDILSLEEMKSQFKDAVVELELKGFFNKVPDEIICEKSFEFSHPLLPNTVFTGRIDAIYKFNDKYCLIDFKTGANKEELSYLISENGINFKTKTGKESNIEQKQNQYEYQIPIYHFACKYSKDLENIKDKVESIGLIYVRPKNKNDGAKEDIISSFLIEEFESKIFNNLKETVIDKIRNTKYFEPRTNEISCANCSFKSLCELNSEEKDA